MSFGKIPSYLYVTLLFGVVLFSVLGTSEVFQVSEAREGFVVEEILNSGEWILPLRNGMFIPSKPPLFHWIGALLTFGNYDEFYLRLPSFLAALGTLLIVGAYGSKIGGALAGTIAVALLSSMYGFARLAADGRVDMLFCFFTTWATLTAFSIVQNGPEIRREDIIKFSLIAGLAVLTKGPTGVAVPFLILAVSYAAFFGGRKIIKLFRWEFLTALILPLPWYFAAYIRGQSAFVERQLLFENIKRFFGGEGISEKDSLFYLPHLITQGAPWSILFFLYLFFLCREAYRKKTVLQNRFLPSEHARAKAIVLNLLAFGVLLTLLTFAAGKRRAYLLLLLPSMALILSIRFASTYERLQREGKLGAILKRIKRETLIWGFIIWCIGIFPGLVYYFIGQEEARILDSVIPRSSQFFFGLQFALIRGGAAFVIIFFSLALSCLLLWMLGHRKKNLSMLGGSILLFCYLTVIFYTQVFLTLKGHTHTYKRFALRLATTVPPQTVVTLVKTDLDESFDGLFFYFKRHMPLLDPRQEIKKKGVYLARREWIKENGGSFFGEEYFNGGRIVDKPGKELVLFEVK